MSNKQLSDMNADGIDKAAVANLADGISLVLEQVTAFVDTRPRYIRTRHFFNQQVCYILIGAHTSKRNLKYVSLFCGIFPVAVCV